MEMVSILKSYLSEEKESSLHDYCMNIDYKFIRSFDYLLKILGNGTVFLLWQLTRDGRNDSDFLAVNVHVNELTRKNELACYSDFQFLVHNVISFVIGKSANNKITKQSYDSVSYNLHIRTTGVW